MAISTSKMCIAITPVCNCSLWTVCRLSFQYSEKRRKLFVRPFVPCPFTFRAARSPPRGSIVRALPIYVKPEHVQDVVKRCPNHMTTKLENESAEARSHLIRSEHQLAQYFEDPYSGRLSVVFPHEEPQGSKDFVDVLLRTC